MSKNITVYLKIMEGSLILLEYDMDEKGVTNKAFDAVREFMDTVTDEQIKIIDFPKHIKDLKDKEIYSIVIKPLYSIKYVNGWTFSQFYKKHGLSISDKKNTCVWVNDSSLYYEVYKWKENSLDISSMTKKELEEYYWKHPEDFTSIAKNRIDYII